MLEIGHDKCTGKDQQAICSHYVTVERVFFDGRHKAAGCIKTEKVMGMTIGPSAFCTGFKDAGIQVNGGHETILTDSWASSYYWDRKPAHDTPMARVAIEFHGQDNYLSNVIIFDGGQRTALHISGGANVISGVHSWGGPVVLNGTNTIRDRIMGCYIDYTTLVLAQPSNLIVQNTFFLNGHTVLWGAGFSGLIFKENIYHLGDGVHGGKDSVVVSKERPVNRSWCRGVFIEDEINADEDWRVRSTRARLSLTLRNRRLYTFNFSKYLLFPWIDEVTYSVTFSNRSKFLKHGARDPNGTAVTIEFEGRTDATVTVDVTQCPYKHIQEASEDEDALDESEDMDDRGGSRSGLFGAQRGTPGATHSLASHSCATALCALLLPWCVLRRALL